MKLYEHCYHNLISSHMLDSQVRAMLSWGIEKGFILQRVKLARQGSITNTATSPD